MADWGQPLDYMIHTLTNPQLQLLSWARGERIKDNRQWQMTVASLPLQENPQELFDEIMGDLDGEGGSSEPRSHSREPYLHELSPFVANSMGIPVRYVDIKEESGG